MVFSLDLLRTILSKNFIVSDPNKDKQPKAIELPIFYSK